MVQPLEFQTRLVFPFCFQRGCLEQATKALSTTPLLGPRSVWEPGKIKRYYRDGLTGHVAAMLFASGSDEPAGGAYLCTTETVARWFQGAAVALREQTLGVRLEPGCSVELFLTRHGSGLLSITLRPQDPLPELDVLIQFNYELAQLARRTDIEATFGIPHPRRDAERWAKIPEAQRAELERELGDLPPEDAPLEVRLGRRGTSFRLSELLPALLAPLEAFGMRHQQHEFSVYTVVRLDSSVDFGDETQCKRWLPLLSLMAQVEESRHAGAPAEALIVPYRVLNRSHCTAVSLQGAAHFVADQVGHGAPVKDTVPFNEERLQRVRDRYFIPYVVAMMQRITLHKAAEEAQALLGSWSTDAPERLTALRAAVLDFNVSGYPPEVSLRSALHEFYRLAQAGLDVTANFVAVRQAIADMDAMLTLRRQAESIERQAQAVEGQAVLTKTMAETVKGSHEIHVAVEWIEIFLVSVYATELWHILAPVDGHWRVLHEKWVGVLAAIVSGAITAAVLRPWAKRSGH